MLKGLKKTPFRLKLLEVFQANDFAISNKEIEAELVDFDRITLYRTLKAFKEKGIIHIVKNVDAETFYALCKDKCSSHEHHHQHIHFTCSTCGHHFCIDEIDPMQLPIELEGYGIEEIEVTIKGICKDCKTT